MDTKHQHLLLGTFLHDIGKVMQRAEVLVTETTQNLMACSGPSWDGRPTHYHVQWTSQFFEQHWKHVQGIPKEEDHDCSVQELAFRHHNPSTPLQEIVSEADRLSSGMDRGEKHYERDVHKRKPLIPLRCLLGIDAESSMPKVCCPFVPLSAKNDSCYPVSDAVEERSLVNDYQEIWHKYFIKDWNDCRAVGTLAVLAYFDALYERYFWCVPASAIDRIPDCSLYEHSRMAAAIASALYLYHQETQSLCSNAVRDREQEKFLLVSGDLSGIQKYIFAIAHLGGGKVAKRLRARSFLLSRISQVIAHQIVAGAGMTFLNIILNAGGKFHLLLPNTPRILSLLDRTEAECQHWLRDNFQGELALNLAYVPMRGQNFMERKTESEAMGVTAKFSEVAAHLQLKKHQPLRRFLSDGNGWIEDRFLLPKAAIREENPLGQYDIESPYDEEKLGSQLTKARCLAIYNSERTEFVVLGWSFAVSDDPARLSPEAHSLISFERHAEREYRDPSVPVHYEYRASHVPTYEAGVDPNIDRYAESNPEENIWPGQVLPFTAIAHAAKGRKTIAYLKADVDDLGYLLQHGLDWKSDSGEPGWTFSKMASFSRSLEFFFSGRIENLLRGQSEAESHPFRSIYTVYSGGDDVLLVGPWNVMHDFARTLHEEWRRFCAGNERLTLSLGISLSRPLTPVWAATEAAETALNSAKKRTALRSGAAGIVEPKDQICSFGHLIKWQETDTVFGWSRDLAAWIESKKISASFARNLLFYADLWERYAQGEIEGLRYLPLLSYSVSRNRDLRDADEIMAWLNSLKAIDNDPIRHLKFVATYALYCNRS